MMQPLSKYSKWHNSLSSLRNRNVDRQWSTNFCFGSVYNLIDKTKVHRYNNNHSAVLSLFLQQSYTTIDRVERFECDFLEDLNLVWK